MHAIYVKIYLTNLSCCWNAYIFSSVNCNWWRVHHIVIDWNFMSQWNSIRIERILFKSNKIIYVFFMNLYDSSQTSSLVANTKAILNLNFENIKKSKEFFSSTRFSLLSKIHLKLYKFATVWRKLWNTKNEFKAHFALKTLLHKFIWCGECVCGMFAIQINIHSSNDKIN